MELDIFIVQLLDGYRDLSYHHTLWWSFVGVDLSEFFQFNTFFYKCGQYFLHVLVKGDGLLSSNAFLGSLSVLSWYTRFHFVDNSVGLLFEVLCILIFVKCCATGLASTPKTKLKQYIYVIIYFKVLFSNFGTFKLTSLHYFTYIMSIIEDGKSKDNCLLL